MPTRERSGQQHLYNFRLVLRGVVYRYQSNARLVAELVHLPLFLPIQQIVVILHAHELRPPIPLRAKLHHGELVCPHRACANVPDFSALHQIMQCAHSLLNWDICIEAMYLQQVEVWSIEAREGGIDGGEDGLARQSGLVHVVFALLDLLRVVDGADTGLFADGAIALGKNEELVPGDVVLLDGFANDLLGEAVRVDVGRVPLIIFSLVDVQRWI